MLRHQSAPSKPWQIRKLQLSFFDVHAAILRAAVQARNGLVRIEQNSGIKSLLHPPEGRQFLLGKLHAHGVDFFYPDSVLASDGAADLDAKFQYLRAKRFSPMKFSRCVGIK